MYKDTGNGSIVIAGIECFFPEKPSRELIQNYELPKKDQKWKKTELPVFKVRDIDVWDGSDYDPDDDISWEEAVRQETIKSTGCDPTNLDRSNNPKPVPGIVIDPDYTMECLETFRTQELMRIHFGHWIFINGKAYYLPGPYYFYLNYYWCGDCFPEFRYQDLELMWLWEFVRKSPVWLGVIYITMRGTGKSYLGGAIDYWTAITKKEARNGIQSKNDDDAADFFREKILIPVTKLPEFLRGIHKDMFLGDITGNASIDFSPPARKAINIKVYNKMQKIALRSMMDYRNSSEKAYDGQSLSLYIADEIGKTEKHVADVFERWQVVFNCVWRGGKKRGSAFLTSTVERMELGGRECKKIWDNSDPSKINENGRTATGLIRYFRSALDATYFDEYGFPDREKAKKYHDAERASRQHDQQSLVGYKQKNPYTAEEAFWVTSNKCIYNTEILLTAKDGIVNRPSGLRKGNFEWKVKDKEVIWVDDEVNPRWQISFFPDTEETNQVQTNYGSKETYTPKLTHKRVIGFDPFQAADLADETRGSNAAAVIYNKFDYNVSDEFCNTPIGVYLYRPPTPQEAAEDIIKAAFYFSCKVLCENNKGGLDFHYYLKLRGYKWGHTNNEDDFVMGRPESTLKNGATPTDGIYVTDGIIEQYTNATQYNVLHHGWKLKFVELIDQLIQFDPTKTKKFDLAVAFGLSLLAAEAKIEAPPQEIEITNLISTYNNSGSVSKAY